MMRRTFLNTAALSTAAAAVGAGLSVSAQAAVPKTEGDAAKAWAFLSGEEQAKHVKSLPMRMQRLAAVSALTAIGDDLTLADVIRQALTEKVEPLALREAIMQVMPYAGVPLARSAEDLLLAILEEQKLPFPQPAPAPEDGRFDVGLKIHKGIFGPAIDQMHRNAKADERPLMVDMLTSFCFADGYARPGLTLQERELLTFAVISALGGCEPQVKAHAGGNISVGNTRQMLLDTLVVLNPIIGFPKTLNALGMVNEAAPAK